MIRVIHLFFLAILFYSMAIAQEKTEFFNFLDTNEFNYKNSSIPSLDNNGFNFDTATQSFDTSHVQKIDSSIVQKLEDVSLSLSKQWTNALSFFNQDSLFVAIPLLQSFVKRKKSYYKKTNILIAFDYAAILLLESYLKLGDYEAAKKVITFIQKDSFFQLDDFVSLQESKIWLQQGNNFPATLKLINLLKKTQSPYVFHQSKSLLTKVITSKGLSTLELHEITESNHFSPELMNLTLLTLANQHFSDQQHHSALIHYQNWMAHFPNDKNYNKVHSRYQKILNLQKDSPTLLLMLPLSGTQKNLGDALLKGVATRFNQEKAPPKLRVIDTKGNAIYTIQKIKQELHHPNIAGVIGPALSSTAITAALTLQNENLPIITPTANQENLHLLNENLFILNSNPNYFIKNITNYIHKCSEIKNIVVLAPNSVYGRQTSEMLHKVLNIGHISISSTEFYGQKQSSSAIKKLKSSLIQDSVKQEAIQTDVKYKKLLDDWVKDSVIKVDGIFIIAHTTQELIDIYSQIDYHQIETTVLGTASWQSLQIKIPSLNQSRKNKLFIGTDFSNYNDLPSWKNFNQKFLEQWGTRPKVLESLGYDAAEMFLITQGSSPKKTIRKLKKTKVV